MRTQYCIKSALRALILGTLAFAAQVHAATVQDAMGHQYNAQIDGNHLFLLENGKKTPAPDGIYKIDGSVLQVRAGALVPPGAAQGFNPQPDPPGKVGSVKPGEMQALNPQPLPPGAAQGFNPQPDPPGKVGAAKSVDTRALNPQPLPP